MDIWKWVNQLQEELERNGNERLAALIDEIPRLVTNDEHAQVDAMVPEAISSSRQLKLPWLEIYFRHWYMQSRVSNRNEGHSALGEAVGAVEFAHREGNRECPQAVCSVHDLSICYGVIDGPGFAEERKKVVEETLARIDPSWPCFDCISGEYASVLHDQDLYEEGLAFVDKQISLRRKAKVRDDSRNLEASRIDHLIELGRCEEALVQIDRLQKNSQDERDRWISFQLDKTVALCHLQRWEEAKEALPAWGHIADTAGFYPAWSEAVQRLVEGKVYPNTWELSKTFSKLIGTLSKQGAVRSAFEIAETQAELALARGGFFVAEQAIKKMESLLPLLHRPLDAPGKIDALRAKMRESGPVQLDGFPETPQALLDGLGTDPEQEWARIERGLNEWPHEQRLVLYGSNALRALGFEEEAETLLRGHLQRYPDAKEVALALGELLQGSPDTHRLLQFCDEQIRHPSPEIKAVGHLGRALWLQREKKWAESNEHLQKALEYAPDSQNSRLIFADNAIALKQWAVALAKLDEAVALGAEPGGVDWLRMVVATILGKWDVVRASCSRLDIPLNTTEGPIVEDWGGCRIQFGAEQNSPVYYAQRTGPVTARILQVAHPEQPQHFGEEVVFSARPLNDAPSAGEEEGHLYLYPHIEVLRGNDVIAFDLDGVHPGESELARLTDLLVSFGGTLQVRSNEQYKVFFNEDELDGFYAYACISKEVDLRVVYLALEKLCAPWTHPLVFVRIARCVGDPAWINEQEERMEKYCLTVD